MEEEKIKQLVNNFERDCLMLIDWDVKNIRGKLLKWFMHELKEKTPVCSFEGCEKEIHDKFCSHCYDHCEIKDAFNED